MIAELGQLAWRLLASLAVLAGLAAVSLGSSEPSLNEEALQTMEVRSVWAGHDPVPLTDGEYRAAMGPESGSADAAESPTETEIVVRLTEQTAFGELDGRQAAGAVLITGPGRSGISYTFLAIVLEEKGEPVNVASSLLGPWVQVDSIAIEGDEIIIDAVVHGPDDVLCCPTQKARLAYVLRGETLTLRAFASRSDRHGKG